MSLADVRGLPRLPGKPGLVLGRERGLLGAWRVYPILSREQRVSPRAVSRKEWEEASPALWPSAELGWSIVPSPVCSPSVTRRNTWQTNTFQPQ